MKVLHLGGPGDRIELRALNDGRVLVVVEETNALLGTGAREACYALSTEEKIDVARWLVGGRVEPRSAQRARWEERGERAEEHCEERDDE